MDDLVLLAQMHGSGTDTVKALRAHRVLTVQDVAGLDPKELERLAGLKPAAARKMCQEARRMAGKAIESGLDSEAAIEEVDVIGPSAITGRTKPRRHLADIEARIGAASHPETEREEPVGFEAELDDGVNPEEAFLLREARRPRAAVPRTDERADWHLSFFRFG
jgi:hypothetical protein